MLSKILQNSLKTEIFLLILQFIQLLVSNGLEALAFFNWKLFENIVHRIQRGENQHLPNFFLFQKRKFLFKRKNCVIITKVKKQIYFRKDFMEGVKISPRKLLLDRYIQSKISFEH